MEKILFLAYTQDDGLLPKAALETLNAAIDLASKLQAPLSLGLIGDNVQAAADAIAGCGAQEFFAVEGPDFASSRYASDAAAAEALARRAGATLVLAPSVSRFARSLPGAALRLDGRIETHVCALDPGGDSLSIQRWYYRQRMIATLTRSQRPWFLLIDPGVFKPWEGQQGQATVDKVTVALPENARRTRFVGFEAPAADAQTIRPEAELLFVAGAGWTKKQADGQPHVKEAEKLIHDFITKAKASLGSSKSLVDQTCEGGEVISLLSHLNQVGQTGATPRHPKGLATCCHGEEPHTVGWRFINERRAVNLDGSCGWAIGKADVLYVADAFQVMAKVNELLGD
ncbi:MAG: electron transfer flavoprotein subunit alpha [Desulfuromonadaceae bacterium]|nr:electron transfer flavoprotein subunit alpha [Desulfuromonadaceae bacterium]